MAKCITKNNIALRVSDSEASKMTFEEGWEYIDKRTYREMKEREAPIKGASKQKGSA